VQDKRQQLLAEHIENIPATKSKNDCHNSFSNSHANDVIVVSYFEFNFKAQDFQRLTFVDSTVKDFSLNTEQQRAFRIIANHSSFLNNEQLNMYLGGMAGTGKSQVIKALMDFFAKVKELH
jgi:predicted AAA+ superfamily ATPase